MSVSVTWIGLDELRAALTKLPEALTQQAAAVVAAAATDAAAEIKAAYPDGDTGNLRKGVRVSTPRNTGPFSVKRQVRSTAPHAVLYERGTQTRQTALGYNRGHMFSRQLGASPRQGANIFIPIVERRRRAMFDGLVAIVKESGLDVRR